MEKETKQTVTLLKEIRRYKNLTLKWKYSALEREIWGWILPGDSDQARAGNAIQRIIVNKTYTALPTGDLSSR